MTKLELKQKELIELLKRIFETDTLDLPKVDKLESKIAKLEKQAETEFIHERIKPYISDEEAVVSKWIREDKEKQAEEQEPKLECDHPSYERVIDQDGHEYCDRCYKHFES
jgi:hypothetical protein